MNTGPRIARLPAVLSFFAGALLLVLGCGDSKTEDGFDIDDGTWRGELAAYMSDDFVGRADTTYVLRAPSGVERPLLFTGDIGDLVPGVELKVWGTETPAGLQVSAFRVVSPPILERKSALQAGAALRDRAFAFVLVDFGGGVNVTSETVMNRMVNDANSIRNYFLYDSYGRQNISAQVFGPISATGISASCASSETSNLARTLKMGLPTTFQHYLWYFGSKQPCSWAGLASVGTAASPSKDTWYNASTGCVVLVQEPGHNFGMQHSSSIRCTGMPLADDTMGCTASEYGDPFDPMGGGCRHMNAWQKAYQGWFGGCNGVNVTSSGSFTLLPYEMRCEGTQFLKIKAPKTRTIMRAGGGGAPSTETLDYYYVELRTPLDFDGTLNGGTGLSPRVLLHIANDVKGATSRAIHPYIIDMTPGTNTFSDAAFAVGQTFTDPAGGLTITATAVSATQATITVEIAGGSGAPTCLDATPFEAPGAGPESCVTNTATPVGMSVPGSGGASGFGGASGSGGRPGTGGVGGPGGRGGSTGSGGASGTGGARTGGTGGPVGSGGASSGGASQPGSGGRVADSGGSGTTPIATGGAPAVGSGGAGPIGPGVGGGGGSIIPTGPGVGGNDVVGGCTCSTDPAGGGPGHLSVNLIGAAAAALLLTLRARRRVPARGKPHQRRG